MGIFFTWGALIALADQIIKQVITARFILGESLILIPGFLDFTHVRNRGGAFGIFGGLPPVWGQAFFITATLAALIFVFCLYRSHSTAHPAGRAALVMIFGGGGGNLIDRVLWGEVIDFVDIYYGAYHWPAFNLADSCITVGVILLALDIFRRPAEADGGAADSSSGA
ncbi:MAG: signal peptidase II [bacterium]|nr:signal peptidase II [bacterium]